MIKGVVLPIKVEEGGGYGFGVIWICQKTLATSSVEMAFHPGEALGIIQTEHFAEPFTNFFWQGIRQAKSGEVGGSRLMPMGKNAIGGTEIFARIEGLKCRCHGKFIATLESDAGPV